MIATIQVNGVRTCGIRDGGKREGEDSVKKECESKCFWVGEHCCQVLWEMRLFVNDRG